jgi:organic hydroperoxide reductase OsmC/OhrA
MDIPVEDAEVEVRTHFDIRGRLLMDEVDAGASKVTVALNVTSAAPTERVRELVSLAERACHVMHTIRNPTPVEGVLVHNGQESSFGG